MSLSFWHKLKKPFFVLAPMANVTDAAFRKIIAKYGKPDVFYTEFVSANGLASAGREALMIDLKYDPSENPIIAQFFTDNPENMHKAAQLAYELGFAGIDINMGCPDKNVMKQGAGACLIKKPQLARELIKAAKEGGQGLPVSVKTRIGDTKNELKTWLSELLTEEPATIIIHCRTRKEMSKVPARWEHVKEAVEIAKGSNTLIVGNGDVNNLKEAEKKVAQTGCDGVMLGRAIFGNPWLFNKKILIEDIPIPKRLSVMLEHTELFEKLLGQHRSFHIMRKHYKAYANGFKEAKELRIALMSTENAKEVKEVVKKFLKDKDLKDLT
ncbi:MAG: tRNA-dihydrouridine synthase [Patescibacteria group bacterium]|nr:MAG: tRNA-dihydrouridine synthase [Patescibacteria group bacterium]